ncbi:condensin complex subunit 2/barren [Gautieria morchelliformis]|nr:condensin complex subunit 2/barren [Gautieria morchelliformis]
MPRSTRTRTQTTYTDSDSSDPEDTPKAKNPPRPTKKKRVSDVFRPEHGSPVNANDTRSPLKSVDINDDTAEKRRRRKSTKPFLPPMEDADAVRPADDGGTRNHARANQLNVVEDAPIINVPLDVMSSNFEEWMKMATDNKINAANSWNFALIDYFHDMSLLRNVTDNSINFQKASCTLDGCVKIWTSRVDSVGTETGKLLSNLANEGRENDESADPGDDAEPGAEGSKKRTKAHRPEATLAKNVAQLRTKKLDLEFTVDPLFKKTCADFDESGAQGLLMNHLALGLGGSVRVVFDAGDSAGAGAGEDGEEEPEEPEDLIDLSFLRKEFIPSLDVLDNKAISHSLEGFSFQKDAFSFDDITFLNTTTLGNDTQDSDSEVGDMGGDNDDLPMDFGGEPAGGEPVEDFFVGDQAVQDDYGGDEFGVPEPGNAEGGALEPAQGNEPGAKPNGAFEPFDPRRMPNERDLVMAMTDVDGEGGMMDYFDQNFLKNWAGPEHWKLRKPVRKVDPVDSAAPKTKREKKEAFKIDFNEPLETSIQDLFAPVTGRGAGINLPASKSGVRKAGKRSKAKDSEKRYDQTLPDDMHFSSRQLVTLFLKPKFALKMRGYRVRINEGDGEVDENFWAQAAADQAAGLRADEADETADGGAIPFNTQFFHDDYDDGPGFDDVYEGDGDAASGPPGATLQEDQDLLVATQGQGRRIRPEFVNYTKRAKRVDVRKLKENIWKGLNIVVRDPLKDDEDESMESEAPTDPSEARTFDTVITGLQQSYPQEKMEEISTSFCFICLLHLANEQGLKIEVGESEGGDEEKERKVGDLWGLKVYRDPNAAPAA